MDAFDLDDVEAEVRARQRRQIARLEPEGGLLTAGTITPRRNQPSSPPDSRLTESSENRLASPAKSAPWRSWPSSESALVRAAATACESGRGTTTIWRNDTVAGRFGRLPWLLSQYSRI